MKMLPPFKKKKTVRFSILHTLNDLSNVITPIGRFDTIWLHAENATI